MGDVIDFKSRSKVKTESFNSTSEEPSVIDISGLRADLIDQERRKVKRTLLTEFISVHAILPGAGLFKVTLFDINENGMAFDVEKKRGSYQVGEEVAMRVYINAQTYFSFVAKVKHVTWIADEESFRHGCEFVKGSVNDQALFHFVKFLENVTATLKQDRGEVSVTRINS